MNIIEAIEDQKLFRPFFKDLSTWQAWLVYLRALFGLRISGAGDRKLFSECTGLSEAPREMIRESFVVCGRRSGKSFISAVTAVYLATFRDWVPWLCAGERGMIFIIAVDKAQAGIIKHYVSGLFHGSRILRAMIEKETREEIQLKNRVSISVKTCSFRTLRGYTVLCAILEEIAFWRSEESANPDREVLAAIRPSLATVPESLLIGISTPYSRSGVLWEQFKSSFGQPGKALIWKAPSKTMNPTLSSSMITAALAEDPAAARAEWEAEWREDVSAFIPSEVVEACIVPGRFELPRLKDVPYFGFLDPSGGRQDAFTLAIAHKEKSGKVVLDVLRERRPPFKPQAVVEEFSGVLRTYGIRSAGSDRYAGEWVTEAFGTCGITIENAELSASELYLELLPVISNGSVELLDSKRLAGQLAGLERRARAGGKDLVTHYPGGHDDLANAVAGAVARATDEAKNNYFFALSKHDAY
jgi:hypothetical protein